MFHSDEAYEEYKKDGLCQHCQDELGRTIRGAKLNAFRHPGPLYSNIDPRYPLVEEALSA